VGNETVFPVSVTTNHNVWKSTIPIANDREVGIVSRPWARLQIPENEALANTIVTIHIALDVTYPQWTGARTYEEVKKHIEHDLTLKTAPAGAGTRYDTYWWVGMLGAIGAFVVAGMILVGAAVAFKQRANPVRVIGFVPDDPD
jgi:hypothetical protein